MKYTHIVMIVLGVLGMEVDFGDAAFPILIAILLMIKRRWLVSFPNKGGPVLIK